MVDVEKMTNQEITDYVLMGQIKDLFTRCEKLEFILNENITRINKHTERIGKLEKELASLKGIVFMGMKKKKVI